MVPTPARRSLVSEALITNAWAGWLSDPLTRRHLSRVVLEGCGDFTGFLRSAGRGTVVLVLPGARLNMPPAVLHVYDGVLEEVEVRAEGTGVTVQARVNDPTEARLTLTRGVPARAVLDFPATPLVERWLHRVVVLDAGHGTPDPGGRGPVDLLEKDVVLDMTLRLERLVLQAGGVPVLTRRGDAGPSEEERAGMVHETRPAAVVSLHTHAARNRHVQGFAVFYHQPAARALGEAVRLSLAKKMGLVDRGLHPAAGPFFSPAAHQPGCPEAPGAAPDGPPSVTVETVTISNPVEEGWLRSYVFRQRMAQAVFNGLSAYLRVTGAGTHA